jgi:hypothetical protein
VTTHVTAAVAVNEVPLTEHPAPVTLKLTEPEPSPPEVVSAIAVAEPTVPVSVVFDTLNVA